MRLAALAAMRILLTGATGFIGRRLLRELLAAGHRVVCAGRTPPPLEHARCAWLKLDFVATPPEVWLAHLQDKDVVVNLVGVFRERGADSVAALQARGPQALFDACAAAGVGRVVHVSALGADARAESALLLSQHEVDRHLLALPLDASVAQPSLVFGLDERRTDRLLALAGLPVLLLPAGGRQRVQPVHVDDVVQALRELVEAPPSAQRGRRLALVGPQPLTMRAYLLALRRGLGLPPPRLTLAVPASWMTLLAGTGARRRGGLFDAATWAMLQRGSTADPEPLARVLGRLPRPVGDFVSTEQRSAVRAQAQLAWLLPLLRLSLAAVWLWAGVAWLAVRPQAQSQPLLARIGLPATLEPIAWWSIGALALLLGLLTLWPLRARRGLWGLQAALVGFCGAAGLRLHPDGRVTSSLPLYLPLLAVLVLLWHLEPPR